MLLFSRLELEAEGPPRRAVLLSAVALTPILCLQIVTWVLRILSGFEGEPLQVSAWFDIDVLVSEPTWHFAAAVMMYVIMIAFSLLLLWACSLQFQLWWYWRGRKE
jgi:hypothetical protein